MSDICFVNLYAYSLFNDEIQQAFGGSEVRSWWLAKGLSEYAENNISFVVANYKQRPTEKYDKVRVFRHSSKIPVTERVFKNLELIEGKASLSKKYPFVIVNDKSLKTYYKVFETILLLLIHRSKQRIQARFRPSLYIDDYEISMDKIDVYKKINAEIYCCFGVHNLAAEIAAFCQQYNKHFVLVAGSDVDFSEKNHKGSQEESRPGRLGHLCYYAITQADLIVTQTKHQQNLLKQRFGRESITITNPIDLSRSIPQKPYIERHKALWVGKSDDIKRPELVIELARQFTTITFTVVMNLSNAKLHQEILKECPENVQIVEFVSFKNIETYFNEAFILINTSTFEGYPNTFLQAGKYAVPILSMVVDPDNFITEKKCGLVTGPDIKALIEGLQKLIDNKELAETFSKNIQAHVTQNHNLEDKVLQLHQTLNTLR